MKTSRHFVSRITATVLGFTCLAAAAENSASELAAKLSAVQQDGASYVRLKMEVKQGGASKATFQLQIKQRRTSAASDVLYQVLFPREQKGTAVLLHQNAGHAATGTLLEPPDKVQTFDSAKMKESLLGSDLSYEDIVENFFAWPGQSIVGTEDVNGTSCQVLESKPGKGGSSIYGSVKSWIDARHMVPMRIEKYLASGQLGRRIDTTNVESDDQARHLPAGLVVTRPGSETSTVIEGSRINHGAVYAEGDLTAAGMKDLSAPHYSKR